MIRLIIILLQLLAACGGTMVLQKKHPSNWGRSYPLQNTTPSGPEVELVRLELEQSTDVTIYLNNGTDDTLAYPNNNEAHVRFGNGATSRSLSVFPSVLGSVIHVVAQTVLVSTSNYSALAPTNVLGALRVSAMAALGRPYETTRRLYSNVNSTSEVLAGGYLDFILDPWTVAIQLSVQLGGVAALAGVTVVEINRNPSGDTWLAIQQPVSNYAFFKTINPFCNVLRVSNTNLDTVYADVVESLRL